MRDNDKRILLPCYTGLGNFILKTPLLRYIHEVMPEYNVDIMVGNKQLNEYLHGGHRYVHNVLVLQDNSSIFSKIRFYIKMKGRYEIAIIPFDTQRLDVLLGLFIINIPTRVGHALLNKSIRRLVRYFNIPILTTEVNIVHKRHEVDLNFDLLDALICAPCSTRNYNQYVEIAPAISDYVRNILAKKHITSYWVFQLCAANGSKSPKIWPRENFRKLIELLIIRGIRIIVIGSKYESNYISTVLRGYEQEVINFAGKIPIQDSFRLISEADGVLCHDSGLMHVANALNVPLIALYGPTDYERTKPLSKNAHIIRQEIECIGCMPKNKLNEYEVEDKCKYNLKCMKDISPDIVLSKIEQIESSR